MLYACRICETACGQDRYQESAQQPTLSTFNSQHVSQPELGCSVLSCKKLVCGKVTEIFIHCVRLLNRQYRDHVKDLLSTSKNMCRTVIVDNNPFSFLLQPSNGIPCIAFSAGQPKDTQVLYQLRISLLIHLQMIIYSWKLIGLLNYEAFGRYSTASEATVRGRRCTTDTI